MLTYLPKMAFQNLASELVHQIYDNLSTVSDVLNLSLSCRRFHSLLRNAHKLSTLFAAADREFGPIEDIKLLVTYNHTQSINSKRDPPLSYPLLCRIISVGMIGRRLEQLYPTKRWDVDFINRRSLTGEEAYRVRRAVYRYWLYSEAFHNRSHPRSHRLIRGVIEERSQLLRNWTNQELIEIEDIRTVFEDILTFQICPTDGTVMARTAKDLGFGHYSFIHHVQTTPKVNHFSNQFHSIRDNEIDKLPPSQARTMQMEGWGDEIVQYHTVQSMLKLNPAQILWLHDHAVHKWQVEMLVQQLGEDWFWNNGQTFSDTWSIVLDNRGLDANTIREGIFNGSFGIAGDGDKDELFAQIFI